MTAAQTDRLLPDDGRPISPLGSDFELPSDDMIEQLDNQAPAKAPAPAAAAKRALPPPATLAFLPGRSIDVILECPFEWGGRVVEAVEVRRLTVAEVGEVVEQHGDTAVLYDFYAAMTGLPVAVLRGLVDDDYQAVAEAAFGFLPRDIRTAFSFSPSGAAGGNTPPA